MWAIRVIIVESLGSKELTLFQVTSFPTTLLGAGVVPVAT